MAYPVKIWVFSREETQMRTRKAHVSKYTRDVCGATLFLAVAKSLYSTLMLKEHQLTVAERGV